MSQVFAFTAEQEEFRGMVRRFVEAHSSEAAVRKQMETEQGFDPAVWSAMAAQLGLQGLIVPEAFGGQGFGAVELVARYGELDLDDDAFPVFASPTSSVTKEKAAGVGLNWYLNSAIRFSFDYQHIDVDRLSRGGTQFGSLPGETPPAGAQIGQELNVFSLRTQLSF